MLHKRLNKAKIHLSTKDKVLKRLIKNTGNCQLNPSDDYFNSLLHAIIGQQLSVTAANAIIKKFIRYVNYKPTPLKIIRLKHEELRSLGLSNAKARYIKDLASKIRSKEISLNGITEKSNEKIMDELTKVKGIGVWTVHMFLIFTLGRLDVLPTGDLGIKKSIMVNYGLRKLPSEQK